VPTGRGRLGGTVGEPGQHGLDDLGQAQAALGVLLGSEAHLGVDHPVGGQVQRALAGDPVQVRRGLHDRHRVDERLQVALEGTGVRRGHEPLPQPDGVADR
jgi:hypothetical protein